MATDVRFVGGAPSSSVIARLERRMASLFGVGSSSSVKPPVPVPPQAPGEVAFDAYTVGGIPQSQAIPLPADWVTVSFLLIGPGTGGGGGFSANINNAKTGGGGGANGAWTKWTVARRLLPAVIYAFVPIGGTGGAAGIAGGTCQPCYLSIVPTVGVTPIQNILVNCGNNNANGGPAGLGASTPGGATGQQAGVVTQGGRIALGTFSSVQGTSGSSPGVVTGAAGQAIVWGATGNPGTGGTGGGSSPAANTEFAGGAITVPVGTSGLVTLAGGLAGGGDGKDGAVLDDPFSSFGGTGGGSHAAGLGGAGGDGAIGSGGGGGGGGAPGGPGGGGGNARIYLTGW